VQSHDGSLDLSVTAHESPDIEGQLFGSLGQAIEFFRRGSLGYSPSTSSECLSGVRLQSQSWEARPVTIDEMRSSVFDDPAAFPKGSCALDFALVMRNLKARWISEGALRARSKTAA
jgi:hypothetical protein